MLIIITAKQLKNYGRIVLLIAVWLANPKGYANQIMDEMWLSVRLNEQQRADTTVFLRATDGTLFVAEQDWQQWRLKKPPIPSYQYNQQNYYNLKQIDGVSYQLNEQDLAVDIHIAVNLFESLSINNQKDLTVVKPIVSTGTFLNYDLSSSINKNGLADSAFGVESGVFNAWGILNNQWLLTIPADDPKKLIRLDSTFTHDQIERLFTVRVGDVSTSNLGHAGSMRIGGLQWQSNFSLQPKKIITPVLTMKGEASLPSNVDVFVNNMRTFSQKVPIGGFEINNIPIVTGKGEADMVIKDLLGREQHIYLPYYINSQALQIGLHEYSYELGWVREDYGISSNNYGRLLANTVHRFGLTEFVTGEMQLAIAENQQNLSYGLVFSISDIAAIQTLVSHSQHQNYGYGHSFGLGFSTQLANLNITNNFRWQSEDFAALSRLDNTLNTQISEDLFIGWPITKSLGSLAVAYHQQQSYDESHFQSLQLSYNVNVKGWFNLSASLTKVLTDTENAVALLSMSVPLGKSISANLHVQPQNGQQSISIQDNLLSSIGANYYLQHSWGNTPRSQATLSLQNNWAQYRFNTSYTGNEFFLQASASGGLTVMDKQLFFSRRINNSFAVVKVGDYPDVKVYKNNQLVGTTNKRGLTLIPQLLPYQNNKLRIDAGDLPFDVTIPVLEKTVVPAFRSGLYADFAVKRAYGATATLLLETGEILPAGAMINNLTTGEQILSGLNGQVYLSNLQADNKIQVNWLKNQCQLNLAFQPQNDGNVPDLGKQVCHMVQP